MKVEIGGIWCCGCNRIFDKGYYIQNCNDDHPSINICFKCWKKLKKLIDKVKVKK